MLIRYVDGPLKGDTVETTAGEIHAVHSWLDAEGCTVHEAVRYRVDRLTMTAELVEPAGLKLVRDASDEDLLAELHARGFRDRIAWLPMRRRRAPFPRAGFGQRWPSE